MPEELKEDTNLSSGRSYIHPVFLGNFAVARQAQLAGAVHKSHPAITNQIDFFVFFLNSRPAFTLHDYRSQVRLPMIGRLDMNQRRA